MKCKFCKGKGEIMKAVCRTGAIYKQCKKCKGKGEEEMKEFYVFTCEHRRYRVKANSKKEANNYLKEQADLSPKDKRIKLEEFGDFEIVV